MKSTVRAELTASTDSCNKAASMHLEDLVEEVDRQMNASHFGGSIKLELLG